MFKAHTHIEALYWGDLELFSDCIKFITSLLLLQGAALTFFYVPFTIIRQEGQNAIKKRQSLGQTSPAIQRTWQHCPLCTVDWHAVPPGGSSKC